MRRKRLRWLVFLSSLATKVDISQPPLDSIPVALGSFPCRSALRVDAVQAVPRQSQGAQPESRSKVDEQDELRRLQSNAVAAWAINIILLIWIFWLYQRSTVPVDTSSGEAIASLLSNQLKEERSTLFEDTKLKTCFRQQVGVMDDIAGRLRQVQDISEEPEPQLSKLLEAARNQVRREESLIDARDAQLAQTLEFNNRDLQDVKRIAEAPAQLIDDKVFERVTETASGVLASVDISIALQAMVLAVLLTAARGWQKEPVAGTEDGTRVADDVSASDEVEDELTARLRSKAVLRFYGRWDDEDCWVLLQSVRLQGTAASLVRSIKRSKSWMGSWSDRVLTALVARSARGMVRRRGWARIVNQTMTEVGREFFLGYLVETAADKALPRIAVQSGEKEVLEVPTAKVLKPESDA